MSDLKFGSQYELFCSSESFGIGCKLIHCYQKYHSEASKLSIKITEDGCGMGQKIFWKR